MVICLERDADLHMVQLMPLPLTVSCFSKIQIGFTFLVPAHPGSPGHRAVKRVFMCVCVCGCVCGCVRVGVCLCYSANVWYCLCFWQCQQLSCHTHTWAHHFNCHFLGNLIVISLCTCIFFETGCHHHWSCYLDIIGFIYFLLMTLTELCCNCVFCMITLLLQ